jgi:hypothetical protein
VNPPEGTRLRRETGGPRRGAGKRPHPADPPTDGASSRPTQLLIPGAPGADVRPLRAQLRRRRLAAFQAALAAVLPLLAIGGLLAAPPELPAMRLAGVALAWWAAALGFLALLVALALQPRGDPEAS